MVSPMTFSTTTDEVLAGRDLTGTVAAVTGGSTGLGRETARALASVGAHVVLAVRSTDRGESAASMIREQVPDARLEVAALDLTSLTSVRAFAAWFTAQHERLSLLVNNAGVMATPLERTADGFELQFGTNHLGHFLLTNLLVPALRAGAPARVVTVSSAGHRASDIDWDDPNFHRRDYDRFRAYGQSKTANILFSVELDRRLSASGVRAYAVHPGMVATELGRHMSRDDLRNLVSRAARSLAPSSTAATSSAPSAPSTAAAPSTVSPSAVSASAASPSAASASHSPASAPSSPESSPVPGPSASSERRRSAVRTVEVGAATSVWAATAPELADVGGVYLEDCRISDGHAPWALDPDAARRLWALSEDLVGERFPAGSVPSS